MRHLFVLGVALGLFGCSDAPQDVVEIDLEVSGTPVEDHELEDLSVTLTRADLAFGPLYLCPGRQAGELCDSARLEFLDGVLVDALEEEPSRAGVMRGVTGPIRSWMFDYGITSLLTEAEPVALQAAEQLGDVSVVLEGEATLSGTVVPFEIEAIVAQGAETETGVQVVRKSTSETFEHEVTTSSEAFEVNFDPHGWVSQLQASDFEAVVVDCEIGVDGSCDAVSWDSDSDVARGVSQEMEAGERPSFSLR